MMAVNTFALQSNITALEIRSLLKFYFKLSIHNNKLYQNKPTKYPENEEFLIVSIPSPAAYPSCYFTIFTSISKQFGRNPKSYQMLFAVPQRGTQII